MDIGADEWLGADARFVGVPRIGHDFHVGLIGTPNNSIIMAVSLGSISPVAIPGLQGRFELDLALPNVILPVVSNGKGLVRLQFKIPNDTRLPGLELFMQCLDTKSLTLSPLDRIALVQ